MKKIVLLLVLAVVMSQGAFLFAQDTRTKVEESEYYYFSFTIEKIYTHRLGYIVLYRNGANRITRTYIPAEWFNTIGGKGEVVSLGTGSEWPSMIVYYNNGVFSHVRLRLRRNKSHETWGAVPLSINMDDYFTEIEEVQLEL